MVRGPSRVSNEQALLFQQCGRRVGVDKPSVLDDLDVFPYHASGVPRDDASGSNVLRHYRPGSDDAFIADLDAGEDDAARADEAPLPDTRVEVEAPRAIVSEDDRAKCHPGVTTYVNSLGVRPIEGGAQAELHRSVDVHAEDATKVLTFQCDQQVTQGAESVKGHLERGSRRVRKGRERGVEVLDGSAR